MTSLPDGTACRYGRKSCLEGKCTGSICQIYDLESCFCSGEHACHICCKNESECEVLVNDDSAHTRRGVGESCQNRTGFCDREGVCVQTDSKSTLDRLFTLFTKETSESYSDWVKTHWYYLVVGSGLLGLLSAIFVLTYKDGTTVQTSAFMYGRFSRIQREAEMQKHYLVRRRRELEQKYERKLQRMTSVSRKRSLPEAVARLMLLFPTVNPRILIQTIKSSANEAVCVKWLLIKNYPFRQFFKPDDSMAGKLDAVIGKDVANTQSLQPEPTSANIHDKPSTNDERSDTKPASNKTDDILNKEDTDTNLSASSQMSAVPSAALVAPTAPDPAFKAPRK